MKRADMTPMLLLIMNNILQKFSKYQYIRVEAWQYPALLDPKSKTLKIMIEVTVGDDFK